MLKKFVVPFAVVLSALALVGAGCSQQPEEKTSNEYNQPVETTNATAEQPAAQDDFALTAEVAGQGSVRLTWATPSDFDKDSVFHLLNSSKDDPNATGVYWYRVAASEHELVWNNVMTGKRNFWVCEYDLATSQCVRYSTPVELEVK